MKIVFLIAYLAFEVVLSCSIPRGWKLKTVEERASIAEMVLYGKVNKSPTKWQQTSTEMLPILQKKEGMYSIELEIYCIFRGGFLPRYVWLRSLLVEICIKMLFVCNHIKLFSRGFRPGMHVRLYNIFL